MNRFITVAQVVAPIFAAVVLGIITRKGKGMTREQISGLQQFVMKYGLPCVLFNSCYTARISAESVSTMAMVLPLVLFSAFWAFRARKKFGCHNFPMLFSAQESGMLGIPLYLILFGADQVYRMGVLDLTQSVVAIPVIALLSSDTEENASLGEIVKKVFSSPFLLMSLLGLGLNLSGAAAWLEDSGFGTVITESTGFLAQPVSALMLFSVGYNFSLSKGNRKTIFRIAAIHFGMFALYCVLIQSVLFLVPNVDNLTRWAVLLYCALPASYLAPSLGRSEEDYTVASGVCSILTVACLVVFCFIVAVAV